VRCTVLRGAARHKPITTLGPAWPWSRDEAALQEHIVSSHLQKYMDGAALLTDLTEVRTLKLAEFGSVNCNYAGECELSGEWD